MKSCRLLVTNFKLIAGGPFIIRCGENDLKYWTIVKFNGRNSIIATSKKEDAAVFSIEKTAIPNEFQIAHYRGKKKESAYFVNIQKVFFDSFIAGSEDGPLQIGGGYAANFTLRTEDDDPTKVDVELWEGNSRFIRVAPRRFQMRSYLALGPNGMIMRVPSRKQDMKNIFMRFLLERIPIKQRKQNDSYFAPTLGQKKLPALFDPIKEPDDANFNFEYEFDPVSNSEEPTQ